MRRPSLHYIPVLAALVAAGCATETRRRDPALAAEARAIEFLKREVPAWPRDNGCYSCHNNGDAARALYAASRMGYHIPPSALADTTEWVTHPDRWDHNKGDPGFSDKRLADVQFAASLAAAIESGAVKDREAMRAAAKKVALAQAGDGSWPIDVANPAGSPATYGAALATYMAWDLLRRTASPENSTAELNAEKKLRAIKPDNIPNATVLLMFLAKSQGNRAGSRPPAVRPDAFDGAHGLMRPTSSAAQALDFLQRAQTRDGGWGPYADSPPEVFDTALALLALGEFRAETGAPEMIRRGREYLIATQNPDGSWPATTRPSGGQSYAQQMSTTGWATLALLATR